jgi:hypothetical protein
MSATPIKDLITSARDHLLEQQPRFWTNDEMVRYATNGAKDLWGALIDLGQEHFFVDDVSNVSIQPNSDVLAGIPDNLFRIIILEPRDMSATNPARSVKLIPRKYNSDDFIAARSRTLSTSLADQSSTSLITIFYDMVNEGPPVNKTVVKVGPQITDTLLLRAVYVPSIAALTPESLNPIPGESDNALIAYIVAFARAKEREDRSPDPNWLTIYKTEKDHIMTRLTPRQVQEPEVVEDLFAQYL